MSLDGEYSLVEFRCRDGPWDYFNYVLLGRQKPERTQLPCLVSTKKSPSSESTLSANVSSVRNEDELAAVNLSGLTICDSLPETTAPSSQSCDDLHQVLAGSDASGTFEWPVPACGRTEYAGKHKVIAPPQSSGKHSRIVDAATASQSIVRFWACPFSKHDPERYEKVYNACTDRPGWENLKRMTEHLQKVHSTKYCCLTCRKRCYKQSSLNDHLSQKKCGAMTEKISDPEWMTPYQEGVFNRRFDVGTADEDKWRATYIYLFPDDPNGPCMNPYYNYTSLTHRLPPSALSHTPQKRCKSLSSEPDQNLHNKRRAPEVSTTTPQTGSSITQSRNLQRYSQLPPEHRTPRDPGYPEIGISRYTDNISWSTFHDSDYGSIDSGIPSSAGPSVPMASSSGHPDHASVGSGIPPSGDPSVLMAPSPGYLPLTKGFPDFSSPTTLEYSDPASPDPVLPSSVLPPDELFETPDMALWP